MNLPFPVYMQEKAPFCMYTVRWLVALQVVFFLHVRTYVVLLLLYCFYCLVILSVVPDVVDFVVERPCVLLPVVFMRADAHLFF